MYIYVNSGTTYWPCSRTNRTASAMFLACIQNHVIVSSVINAYIHTYTDKLCGAIRAQI